MPLEQMLSIATSVSTVFANIAVIIGIVIAIKQYLKQIEIVKKGHEIKRKQATIEFYTHISEQSIPLVDKINEATNGNDDPITYELIKNNDELRNTIRKYLSLMERFSIGISVNVYDLDLFGRIARSSTINMYNRLVRYITEVRRENGSQTYYIDYEKLVDDLRKLKKDPGHEKQIEQTKIKPL